jgi:methyl-accepting chemotaxis protein
MEHAKTATDHLSASIDQIAVRVESTHQATINAVSASRVTQDTILALSDVVAEIDGVTRMITGIARQTNLLAINAGVEATRSGQDGKGFAVIAQEVKSLSEQTSAATSKISSLVLDIRKSTDNAVLSVKKISDAIGGVSAAAKAMAASIPEQVRTTHEIASGIQETASANSEVTERMQRIAVEANATGAQAADVDRMCADVAQHVRQLQSTLVRIVRASSVDVDRRATPRVCIDLFGDAEVGGASQKVVIRDLSTGGARIAGTFQVSAPISLRLRGMSRPVSGKVVEQLADEVRVVFDPSRAVDADLARLISHHQGADRSLVA